MNSNNFRIYVGIPSLTSIDRKTVEREKQQRLKIIHVIEKQQRLKVNLVTENKIKKN